MLSNDNSTKLSLQSCKQASWQVLKVPRYKTTQEPTPHIKKPSQSSSTNSLSQSGQRDQIKGTVETLECAHKPDSRKTECSETSRTSSRQFQTKLISESRHLSKQSAIFMVSGELSQVTAVSPGGSSGGLPWSPHFRHVLVEVGVVPESTWGPHFNQPLEKFKHCGNSVTVRHSL